MKNAHRLLFVLACLLDGCGTRTAAGTDSTTQFWNTCSKDSECGELSCLCGHCSAPCARDACSELSATASCDTEARYCAQVGAVCVSNSWQDTAAPGPTGDPAPTSVNPVPESSEPDVTDVDGGGQTVNDTAATTEPASIDGGQTPELPGTENDGGEGGLAPIENASDAGPETWPELSLNQGLTLATGSIYEIAVASATTAGDALLLFTKQETDTGTAVYMQPFTWDGIAAEDPGRLSAGKDLSLASDGENYLACWDSDGNVGCASINIGDGVTEAVLDVPGRAPAVAYAMGSWYVAYAPDPNADSLVLQRISTTFELAETTALGNLGLDALPALTSTKEGLLLVDTDPASDYDFRSTAFAQMLSPAGDSVAWGIGPWMARPSVFVDEAQVVLSTPLAYGAQVMTHSATADSVARLSGGGKNGLSVAFVDDGAGPIVCWVNGVPAVQRQRVSALDPTAQIDVSAYSQPVAIAPLQLGGRLAVVATTSSPGAGGQQVKFVALD